MKGTFLKRFSIPVLCLLILVGAHIAGAETMKLTLEEAIALGIKNSTTLKAKAVSVYSAKAGVKSAKSAYFPSVSATTTYTHLFDQPKTPDMEIDLGGPAPVSIPGSYAVASDPISLSFDVQQSIFTFG